MLGVIHREVECGEILAPARNGAGGRPEGQNLGAIVAPCGELPSFVLLIRDSVVSPLGNPSGPRGRSLKLSLLNLGQSRGT